MTKRKVGKHERMSLSIPPYLVDYIRQKKNMSAYVCDLIEKDIENKDNQWLIDRIKLLINSKQVSAETINVQLDTLSAINSLIENT